MRLAYLCADPGIPVFGSKGCSIHVQEFLRTLKDSGIDTTLIAARVENPRPIDLAGIRVIHTPVVRSKNSRTREKEAFKGNEVHLSMLRVHAPFDVIYERYSLWSFAGMSFARESGVPGILEVNAPLIEEQAEHRVLVDRETAEFVARRAFDDATKIVAVSHKIAEYLEEFPEARGKISVHPNGVDEQRFRPEVRPALPNPDAFTIGFAGSLKPWHGVETLADAFVSVRNDVENARLLIVGDGPARDQLVHRLEASGAIEHCSFSGKVTPNEVPGLLSSMDVAVAPAFPPPEYGDYFSPLKLFEYLAMGLPVVCSRSGQMQEVIVDGENGLLFTPGSSAELAASLIALSGKPELRKAMGNAARKSILEKHTWKTVVGNILGTVDYQPAKTKVS